MRKKFVVFLGVDGAGKSTLTNLITKEFNEKYGFKFKRLWFRSKVQISLSSFLNKFGNRNRSKISYHKKTNKFQKVIYELYLYMILLDYFLISILFIRIPLFLGKNIVCDRYIYDIILDLASDFDYSETKTKHLINSKLFIEPNIIYLINIPINVAKERRPEHSIQELNLKIESLNKFKQYTVLSDKLIELDGDDKLQIILKKVENSLIEVGL